MEPHILFYSNGLAIWHGSPNIRHIKVNYGRTDGRTDIRGDANTTRPHFVRRGIKTTLSLMFVVKALFTFLQTQDLSRSDCTFCQVSVPFFKVCMRSKISCRFLDTEAGVTTSSIGGLHVCTARAHIYSVKQITYIPQSQPKKTTHNNIKSHFIW